MATNPSPAYLIEVTRSGKHVAMISATDSEFVTDVKQALEPKYLLHIYTHTPRRKSTGSRQ